MKSSISCLTSEDIKGIKRWLLYPTADRFNKCPFPSKPAVDRCTEKCKKLFKFSDGHPCDVFGTFYVTKRAKQFIKRWEKENESI
jgi:hypothetical protein